MRRHGGLAIGALVAAILVAGCASTNGLSSQASLRDANGLEAQSPLLAQQGLEADLRARDLEISIGLVRALGGGFTVPSDSLAAAR